jgi:hypothetical protein
VRDVKKLLANQIAIGSLSPQNRTAAAVDFGATAES